MTKDDLPPSGDDGEEYTYCRYRRCGTRLLDAHAYGYRAWRLRIRRRRSVAPRRGRGVHVRSYRRFRLGKWEDVCAHWRSHPGQLTLF